MTRTLGAGDTGPVPYPCCACGNPIAYPDGAIVIEDDLCYCDICGKEMCDDCQRERDNQTYCLNCYVAEIDPTDDPEREDDDDE